MIESFKEAAKQRSNDVLLDFAQLNLDRNEIAYFEDVKPGSILLFLPQYHQESVLTLDTFSSEDVLRFIEERLPKEITLEFHIHHSPN